MKLRAASLCVLTFLNLARGADELPQAAGGPRSDALVSGKEAPRPPRERTIYVPFKELPSVFETTGRGVFVPYEEFEALTRRADELEQEDLRPSAPYEARIIEAVGEARAVGDILRVSETLSVDVQARDWCELPLRLHGAALVRTLSDGKPVPVRCAKGGAHSLLLRGLDSGPRRVTILLEYAKTYSKAAGRNSVTLNVPPCVIRRWDVRVPGPGVDIQVEPAHVTRPTGAAAGRGETCVSASLRQSDQVTVSWTPKAEGAKGLRPFITVDAIQQTRVADGLVRCMADLRYTISRAPVAVFTIGVPQAHRVVEVRGANIKEWSITLAGEGQEIEVQLFEPVLGEQQLVVELEQPTPALDAWTVSVPVVTVRGACRQEGFLGVGVASSLRMEVAVARDLRQVSPGDVPKPLRERELHVYYRYARVPFELGLSVTRETPRVLCESLVEVHLRPTRITLDMITVYDITRTGLFTLSVDVPAGVELRDVGGVAVGDAAPAQLEAYRLEQGTSPSLTIPLAARACGKVGVALRLSRPLEEADLLVPSGRAVDVDVLLPRHISPYLVSNKTRVVVYAPESLRVNPLSDYPGRPLSRADVVAGFASTHDPSAERAVLASLHSGSPESLSLSVQRRKPHTTVRAHIISRIESGAVLHHMTLNCLTRYSGIKALRIELPAPIADLVHITTPSVRRSVVTLTEEEEGNGRVVWELRGDTEFLGEYQISLSHEVPIAALAVGDSIELDLPRILPLGVDRFWGQIVLAKAESIGITPLSLSGSIRAIDPRHDLVDTDSSKEAARAFEFHGDWGFRVRASRYEARNVKGTSIEAGFVRFVVTRGDLTSVQAIYRMRSVRQRLALALPKAVVFDTQPLRLDGRPVVLEQGEDELLYVPLIGHEQNEPFMLELRYVLPNRERLLRCPEFPEEPAVQRVQVCVYVPEDLRFLRTSGPWNPEFDWQLAGLSARPRVRTSDDELLAWVFGGLAQGAEFAPTFPTDGKRLLFSAIRPPIDASGGLRIFAPRSWLADVLVLALVVAVGVLLLPVSGRGRVLATGVVISSVAICGIFDPTLTRTTLNNAMAGGVFVVSVLWSVQWLLRRPSSVLALAVSGRAGLLGLWTQLACPQTLKRKQAPPRRTSLSPDESCPPASPLPSDADDEAQDGGVGHE